MQVRFEKILHNWFRVLGAYTGYAKSVVECEECSKMEMQENIESSDGQRAIVHCIFAVRKAFKVKFEINVLKVLKRKRKGAETTFWCITHQAQYRQNLVGLVVTTRHQ